MPSSALKAEKLKFVTYNSNLEVRRICHYEPEKTFTSTNAVYFIHYGPFQWITFDECVFDISTKIIFSTEGMNYAIRNSVINMTNIEQVAVS